jgi:hypothetical protein
MARRIGSEYDAATSGKARTFTQHMRRSSLLTALAALVLTLPGTAHAAPWTTPQTLSAPHTFAGPLHIAAQPIGTMVAGWSWQDNVGADAIGGSATATGSFTSPIFSAERPSVDGLVDVVPYARTHTVALGMQAVPGSRGPGGAIRYRLRASVSGGTARTVAVAPVWRQPILARTGSMIVYVETTRTASGALRRIVRTIERRNGGWSSPSTISGRGRADAIAADVSVNNDATVVFVRDGKLLARQRRNGHNWGAIQQLATSPSRTTWNLAVFPDRHNRVRVVWRRHPYRGVSELKTAIVPRGRNTFTAPQTLVADGASAHFGLASTTTGWVVADVEPTPEGPRPVLHRTTSSAGAPWTSMNVAPAQGGIRDVDVVGTVGGTVTVAWVQPLAGQDGDGIIRSATVGAGPGDTTFGPVEDVSPPEAAHEVRLAANGGLVTAVWTARPEGTGPSIPIGQIRTVVRAASRTG